MDRLSSFPFVVVRIGCAFCKRQGSYRLARLAAKLGPETPLDEVLRWVTKDCPVQGERPRRRSRNDQSRCHARFIDLEGPPSPPDLPPDLRKLRVVAGGRRG